MSDHVMDNPRADRVKKTAALATRAGRRKQGLFLAEGPQAVSEALKLWLQIWEDPAGAENLKLLPSLDALYFDPAALERHPGVAGLLDRLRGVLFDPQAELPRHARIFLREATPAVLRAMGDAETSQGVVAVCRVSVHTGPTASAGEAFTPRAALGAVLCGLQDPGNVGTIIRTADAAGAAAVVLSAGSADPWAPKVVRSAAGSHFHLPIVHGVDVAELVENQKAQGVQVLAAAGGAAVSLGRLTAAEPRSGPPDLAEPTLWMLGNEAHGLSEDERSLADHPVSIPIYGQAESLNVAVAASVCLYASAMAQHRSSA